MRSGKVMGEEDTEELLNQGARTAGGEGRKRLQSKGERQRDEQVLRESTAGVRDASRMAQPGSKARDKIQHHHEMA